MNEEYIRKFFEQHIFDSGCVELRALFPDHSVSGIFNDTDKLISTIYNLRRDGNLYYSANSPKLRKVKNVMGRGGALSDKDIAARTRLVFDLDGVRESGEMATREVMQEAYICADHILQILCSYGWPRPVVICSGNGCHLIYRTEMVANEGATDDLYKKLYEGIATISNQDVKFDTVVRNPGRIMRAPGSLNLKGRDNENGEYRICYVYQFPDPWNHVELYQIENMGNRFSQSRNPAPTFKPKTMPAKANGKGDYSSLNIVNWFDSHGLYLKHIEGEKHAVTCPWSNEHTTAPPPRGGDTIIFHNSDGSWPGFHCKHSHCDGRSITDVMQVWNDADRFCTREFQSRKET